MPWRFFTEEGIKVGTTALQVPCCVSKFSIAMLMPAAQPPGCPQQHWTGRAGRLQSYSQSVFRGHENLPGNIWQTISSHLTVCRHMWDGISYQLQSTFYKSEQPKGHDYFYLIWLDSKYGAIINWKSRWHQICSMELVFYLRALLFLSEGWIFENYTLNTSSALTAL